MTQPALVAALDGLAMFFWVLRVAAGVGGALGGWFLMGPVTRLLYFGAFHRSVPKWLMPWSRLGGALLVGLLIFYYLPLGGGGGSGWGPGGGGGPGPGQGPGQNDPKDKPDNKGDAKLPDKDREALEIELLGGTRYQEDGRYYLLHRREPAVTLDGVEDYIKKNQPRLDMYVTIILNPNSVASQHGAVLRLNSIIEKYERIPQIKNVPAAKDKG